MKSLWMVMVLGSCVLASAGEPGKTARSMTYVTHTAGNVMDDPAFLAAMREAPPEVLHLGHVLPLNSIFGPTADFSGWNPQLVPADDILARRDRIRAFTDALHAAGVKKIVSYINPAILGGDHETREGFWALYDHWDEYAALGLGPKPGRDPVHWIQYARQPFGQWAPEKDYPLWLYRPCVNDPAWRRYHECVVRLAAESGLDGVFVDDCIIECHHEICQKIFPAFLKDRYRRNDRESLFDADLRMGAVTPPWQGEGRVGLRDAETLLFWQESMRDYLAAIRATARPANPEFIAIANWGAMSRVRGAAGRAQSGKDIEVWQPATDLVMLEEAHASGYVGAHDVFSSLPQYNQALNAGVRPVILSFTETRAQMALGFAESAAGGGGAFVQPGFEYPELRKAWRAFFEDNAAYLEGAELLAPVALVLAFDELRFNNKEHLRQALATAHALDALHIPYAAIPKDHLRSSRLKSFRVLVLPAVEYLGQEELSAIDGFVSAGGRVLAAGDCGRCDRHGIPRAPAARGVLQGNTTGHANVVHLPAMDALVARRYFDLVASLDLLDNAEFYRRAKEIGGSLLDLAECEALGEGLDLLAGWGELRLARGARNVRLTAYQKKGTGGGTLILHMVHYGVSVSPEETALLAPAPLEVRLPLPTGKRVRTITLRAPGMETVSISGTVQDGVLLTTLPACDPYQMLVVELAAPTR